MSDQFDLVVSAENNHFMAWQCMVIHHSSLTRLGRSPIFVVHGDEPELVDGFKMLEQSGGRVQRAPNFRHGGDIMYAPRNQMKTVELVETDKPWIILCDADMVFLADVDFDTIIGGLDETTIGLDRIPFLIVYDENREILQKVCDRAAIAMADLEARPVNGATPYLIATATRDRLCRAWEPLMEDYLRTAFDHCDGYDPVVWISSMWGLALAVHSLGLDWHLVDLCVHTENDPPVDSRERPILHYSYPCEAFDKRRFHTEERFDELWAVTGRAGHTSGVVCDAIREAGQWYSLPGVV